MKDESEASVCTESFEFARCRIVAELILSRGEWTFGPGYILAVMRMTKIFVYDVE